MPLRQSSGTLPEHQTEWNIVVSHLIPPGPAFFSNSAGMLHSHGAFLFFRRLSAFATSFPEGGEQSMDGSGTWSPRSSTEKTIKWIGGLKKRYMSERNNTIRWTETRGPINFLTSMTGCSPRHLGANGSYQDHSEEGNNRCRNVNGKYER